MRILVTNDDGIDSPGLHSLARMITDAGYDTVVAAPSTEQSGTGAAIDLGHRVPNGTETHNVQSRMRA